MNEWINEWMSNSKTFVLSIKPCFLWYLIQHLAHRGSLIKVSSLPYPSFPPFFLPLLLSSFLLSLGKEVREGNSSLDIHLLLRTSDTKTPDGSAGVRSMAGLCHVLSKHTLGGRKHATWPPASPTSSRQMPKHSGDWSDIQGPPVT